MADLESGTLISQNRSLSKSHLWRSAMKSYMCTALESSVTHNASHLFTLLSPFMAHPLPSDPVGQRGPVFRRKHSAGHVTHTDTQTHHCSGTAGVRRWAGNGVYPLLEAISCPWVRLVYLSSASRALCVHVCVQEHTCWCVFKESPKLYSHAHKKSVRRERNTLPL